MKSLLYALRDQVDVARVALRVCFGAVPLVAGLDKYFNLLTYWPHYLSPVATSFLPTSPETTMHIIGVIEIAVGILVFSPWTVLGSLIAAVWLFAISLNLISAGFFDIAVRDIVLAVAAYTLACLTAEHESVVRGEHIQHVISITTARTAA